MQFNIKASVIHGIAEHIASRSSSLKAVAPTTTKLKEQQHFFATVVVLLTTDTILKEKER
jgi:hypothetical protein